MSIELRQKVDRIEAETQKAIDELRQRLAQIEQQLTKRPTLKLKD